ncbi:signal recognition particle-docking protein FtsY, partial [Streptococcus pneumoniae]
MGLFDRLFGKKEEPKIEEVVKEALENLDLSEDVDPTFTEVEEVSQEEAVLEESQDSEPAVGVSQEEIEELPEEEKLEHEGTIEENNSEVLEP